MASVVGRLTGKPGVCLATLGPGASFSNPDFVKYAESFGMRGYRIKKASELVPTLLKEALNQNVPTLIDIPVDYTENLKLTEKYGSPIYPV